MTNDLPVTCPKCGAGRHPCDRFGPDGVRIFECDSSFGHGGLKQSDKCALKVKITTLTRELAEARAKLAEIDKYAIAKLRLFQVEKIRAILNQKESKP